MGTGTAKPDDACHRGEPLARWNLLGKRSDERGMIAELNLIASLSSGPELPQRSCTSPPDGFLQ